MKTNTFARIIIMLGLGFGPALTGQNLTQNIWGTVAHSITKEPLPGATVKVLDLEKSIGAVTGADGSFTLTGVPLGRRTIQCTYTGFEDNVVILMLTSAKEAYLEIFLREGQFELSEALIVNPNEAINPLTMLSVRSVAPEETQYYPAAANDVGRSMLSLPGVQPSKDNENDIIIRGNSSVGLLWRLEGVDILNPNHFARKGGSAGGITIFSIGLMDRSDFLISAFPAEYGNAFSGVFDLTFRQGNPQKREHTIRAGMIGLDVGSEGPFKKDGASYLFNYRYSTLGLLNKMELYLVGERIQNDFQDLSFSLFFPGNKPGSSLKIWGAGGISNEEKNILETDEWTVFDDSAATNTGSKMGVLGATYTLLPDAVSSLKITLAGIAQHSFARESVFLQTAAPFWSQDENYLTGRLGLACTYSRTLGQNWFVKTGLQAAGIRYDYTYDTLLTQGSYRKIIDGKGNTFLLQPYLQGQWAPSGPWTFNVGLHAMYFGLTSAFSLEPRLGISFRLSQSQALSVGYGLHSRHVPLGSYFTVVQAKQPNLDLPLIKAHHLVFAYTQKFAGGYRFTSELYYQYLFQVPVGPGLTQTYWLLNDIEGYATRALVGKGSGRNYGLDLLFEKHFRKNLFFLLSASVFQSRYTPLSGKSYNTQFNSRFMTALTLGKEWNLSGTTVLQAGAKIMYNLGTPATPLLDPAFDGPKPLEDETHPFSEKTLDYFRVDTRFAFRKNSKGISWLLALDIQNATNRLNQRPFGWEYELEVNRWARKKQAELIPLLSFELNF